MIYRFPRKIRYTASNSQSKHWKSRKLKNIDIKTEKGQRTFYALVAPYIIIFNPFKLWDIDENDLGRSNFYLSNTNALSLERNTLEIKG